MKIAQVYQHQTMPSALVVELDDGSLYLRPTDELSRVRKDQLRPYQGPRDSLEPFGAYIARCYGVGGDLN